MPGKCRSMERPSTVALHPSKSEVMKHLVIGASGQVGGALYGCAHEHGLDVHGTCLTSHRRNLRKLDIVDRARVLRLVRGLSPDVIYATAAMSSADRCEGEAELSYEISVRGIENLIDAANRADAILVHISSDYIFDGKNGPYYETEPASPINVYGLHKLIAEHLITTKAVRYLIVRTTVVYGWEDIGKNFVMHLKSKLAQGQSIQVPEDQIGTPTYNRNLARAIIEAVEKYEVNGVLNITGPTLLSRYEFALQVATTFGLDPRLIKPVSTAHLGQKALRPLKAGLINRKAQSLLETRLLGSEEGLAEMLRDDL